MWRAGAPDLDELAPLLQGQALPQEIKVSSKGQTRGQAYKTQTQAQRRGHLGAGGVEHWMGVLSALVCVCVLGGWGGVKAGRGDRQGLDSQKLRDRCQAEEAGRGRSRGVEAPDSPPGRET